MTGLKLTLKSSFSFEIAVKGYNPAPREMRGNLMDSNLEQDTIRELGMRKQVCEWEEYSELTGPNSYIYGLFVLGYSLFRDTETELQILTMQCVCLSMEGHGF